MKSPHILRAGNPRRIRDNLVGIVDQPGLDAIEDALCQNVRELYALARRHYTFAKRLNPPDWRHCVSRSYYSAYTAARAVRLYVKGEYSTDVKDHQRFWELPADFPAKDRFANQLSILREDRNLCDYDHTARAADLVLGRADSLALAGEFLQYTKAYLGQKGLGL